VISLVRSYSKHYNEDKKILIGRNEGKNNLGDLGVDGGTTVKPI